MEHSDDQNVGEGKHQMVATPDILRDGLEAPGRRPKRQDPAVMSRRRRHLRDHANGRTTQRFCAIRTCLVAAWQRWAVIEKRQRFEVLQRLVDAEAHGPFVKA